MRKKVNQIFYITLVVFCIIGLQTKTVANNTVEQKEFLSIADAKIDRDSNYIPDRLGETVTISGRVSVEPGILWKEKFQFAIQDQTAGMFIFSFEDKWPKINMGDSIEVTGIINQYRGLTQLIEPEIRFIDTLNRRPVKPILLNETKMEATESMLVTTTGQIIHKKFNSGGSYIMLASAEMGETPLMVFIPNTHKTPNLLNKFIVGESIKVSGMLGQHDYSRHLNAKYQIYPLSPRDLVIKQYTARFYIYVIGGVIFVALFILGFNFVLRKKVKNRTNKLKESEKTFSTLTESTSSAILIHLNTQFVYANKACEKISGFSKNDILNNPVKNIISIDEDKLKRIKKTDKTFRSEYPFFLKNKKQIWLDYTIAPITWNNQNASIITAVDVTIQKQAERKAVQSENRFQNLANSAPVGIFRMLPNGFKTYANPKWSELSGMPAHIAIGKGWMTAIHPEDKEKLINRWDINRDEDKSSLFEFRFLHPDGKTVWVMSSATREYDETNNFIGYIGSVTNITELKNAEQLLKVSKEKYEYLFHNNPQPMWIYDLETLRFLEVNTTAVHKYGYSRDEFLKMTLMDIRPKEDKEELILDIKHTSESYNNAGTWRHITKNGECIDVEITSHHVKFSDRPSRMVLVNDITEKKNLLNELIEAKNKAEENDRLKTAFLNNISHEFRTPMNGILGFSELLKTPDLGDDQRDEFLNLIEKSGQRMLNTITEIVEISKIETKQIKLDLKKTNINKIISDLFIMYQSETNSKNLKFFCEPGLPDEHAIVKTDADKLSQILEHLLTNAIKFTKEGSISFGYSIIQDEIKFYVKDTGIGLTSNYKDQLFKNFTQGSTSYTRDYEGLGLGLSISLAYVELMGGKINIESESGKGATFFFDIPYVREEGERMNKPKEKLRTGKIKTQVLIVEDEQISMHFLQIILKNENLNLLFATNGEEAIELIKNRKDIDIVLMDLKMPGMDGFEATRKIKALNPNIHIIAQTAFAFESDKTKAFKAGCNDYISKPIKKELLMGKINSFLN